MTKFVTMVMAVAFAIVFSTAALADVLLAHQAVTNPATVVGSAISVPSITVDPDTGQQHRVDEVRVEVYHAFNESAAANTNGQAILIQTSMSTSGNLDWLTAVQHDPVEGLTPADEVVTTSSAAGLDLAEVAATAGFASEGLIYVRDTVLADSEWALVEEIVTNTLITFIDGLTNAHADTTTSLFASAEKFSSVVSLKGIERIRLVYMNEGATAANTHVKAEYAWITTD
jgi:hypothetical protein